MATNDRSFGRLNLASANLLMLQFQFSIPLDERTHAAFSDVHDFPHTPFRSAVVYSRSRKPHVLLSETQPGVMPGSEPHDLRCRLSYFTSLAHETLPTSNMIREQSSSFAERLHPESGISTSHIEVETRFAYLKEARSEPHAILPLPMIIRSRSDRAVMSVHGVEGTLYFQEPGDGAAIFSLRETDEVITLDVDFGIEVPLAPELPGQIYEFVKHVASDIIISNTHRTEGR